MGMRLSYLSFPDAAVDQLRRDPDLAPSLLVESEISAAPPALLQQMRKQLAAAGLGHRFPRLVMDDADDGASPPPASNGSSPIRPDAVRGDLEKAWHGLHFAFTGRADEAPAPLGYLLSGGEEVGDDLGYGPARYLKPEEVAAFLRALQSISEKEFDRRFNTSAMEQNDIYPNCWDEDRADLLEEYAEYFDLLKTDLDRTAQAKEGLLIAIL